ncbi:MAG: hypothetical protein U0457_20500 [Candidatus Sericytochromatia bacterium]
MNRFYPKLILILFLLLNSCFYNTTQNKSKFLEKHDFVETIETNQFPKIGLWLLDSNMNPAKWLGQKSRDKTLKEPINLIIIDKISKTYDEAINKLEQDCKVSGFDKKIGHSSGYLAKIGNRVYNQLPREARTCFSDNDFWQSNNHGRIFGAEKFNDAYFFVGAFSKESFNPKFGVQHDYISFNKARNKFAINMHKYSNYKIKGRVFLGNKSSYTQDFTTGDHDGFALVLEKEY